MMSINLTGVVRMCVTVCPHLPLGLLDVARMVGSACHGTLARFPDTVQLCVSTRLRWPPRLLDLSTMWVLAPELLLRKCRPGSLPLNRLWTRSTISFASCRLSGWLMRRAP